MQCNRKKASTKKQKTCQTLASFTKKAYLCTRFRCYSSVVERILGKDEVPSSTLGSSSETTAEITSNELSPPYFYASPIGNRYASMGGKEAINIILCLPSYFVLPV